MNEETIRARIAELMFEVRVCGCYCRKREFDFPAYICSRHRLIAELPEVGLFPNQLEQIQATHRNPR